MNNRSVNTRSFLTALGARLSRRRALALFPVILPPPETGFTLEDLYKLLHQAYQGPGHAVPSRAAAERYLTQEWESLETAKAAEPLIEILVPKAPFVRVHLRPYRDRGGHRSALLEAFLRSAAVPVDPAAFREAWRDAGRLINAGRLPFTPESYHTLDAQTSVAAYPAIHHSAAYLEAVRPAYRVLARTEAEAVARELGGRA